MGNIILIGMPGCGKSTVGVALAKAKGMTFLDSDQVIQQVEHATLAQIIERVGQDGFRKVEERVNASLVPENTVLATGGSVIYGPKAMEHLRQIGTVVYLRLTCEAIANRLGDLKARGVSIPDGWTLQDLYNERTPLYERYAHRILVCDGLRVNQIVGALAKLL